MSQPYTACLCAIAKDETQYLEEWVCYHHYLGFDKIFLYDNESQIPISETLKDYVALGFCEVFTIKGLGQQNLAYQHCLHNFDDSTEWLAFFDLDEFLCLKACDDIRVFLQDYRDYAALIVQWDLFSSSGHLSRPEGFVTLNYTESLGEVCDSKTILRPACYASIYSSHHFGYSRGYGVNANYEKSLGAFAPSATDKICLNHYYYRSEQDFAEKLAKTDATFGSVNKRSWQEFYRQARQKNSRHTAIVARACELKERLSKGIVGQKYPVAPQKNPMALPQAVAKLTLALRQNREYAQVLFAVFLRAFDAEPDFLRLGLVLALETKNYARARRLAGKILEINGDSLEYYATELTCQLGEGLLMADGAKREAGRRLVRFLRTASRFHSQMQSQAGKTIDRLLQSLPADF